MELWKHPVCLLFVLCGSCTGVTGYDFLDTFHKQCTSALQEALHEPVYNQGSETPEDPASSAGQLDLFTYEEPEALSIEEKSYIALEAEKALVKSTGLSLEMIQDSGEWRRAWEDVLQKYCPREIQPHDCNRRARYRTMDGSCNNLKHPEWGKSFIPQERYLSPHYDNGIDSPRILAKDGSALPEARVVSNNIFRSDQPSVHHPSNTVMVMAWGQFVDHDIAKTPASRGKDGSAIQCCGVKSKRPECFELNIPDNDPYFKTQKCMNFVRSTPATRPGCLPGPREQLNSVTAYIDASNVYGSTKKEAAVLRECKGGRLKVSPGNLLPPWSSDKCSPKEHHPHSFCFQAGDGRVNVVPNLSALHLAFMREHNRLVSKLAEVNPSWAQNDEKLYQEARKIMAAYMQHITYDEYLPTVLNGHFMSYFRLRSYPGGKNYNYKRNVNPGVRNVFAVASFRYGHSQISNHQALANEQGKITKSLPVERSYHDPTMLQQGNCTQSCPGIVNWLGTDTCTKSDRLFESGVRDKLFLDNKNVSFDLPALNIQRGRDHGIPAYPAWRKWLGLSEVRTFDPHDAYGLKDHTPEAANLLKKTYKHVDDIDLFAGAMSEKLLPGADVGPVFSHLIAKQFRALKEGDRFWYENGCRRIGFTNEQILSIKKVTLAKILCENMGVQTIQPNVFGIPDKSSNKPIKCSELEDLDFRLWKR